MTGDYGAEINELLAELTRITVPARANADWVKIRNLQKRLGGKGAALQSATRRRAALVEDRRWAESDVHGFERALVLVGGEGLEDEAATGGVRLQQRLKAQIAHIDELATEILEMDERIRQIESDIVSTQQILVVILRQTIDNAEEKVRAAQQARIRRTARLKVALGGFDETPLWSPFAVMGYRVWVIKKDGLYGAWEKWETPHFEAVCDVAGDLPHTDGSCAEVAFGCGIYASKAPLDLIRSATGSATDGFAASLVGMEGKVVEHEKGYRAASATVLAFAIAEQGTVRIIDDPSEIQQVFADPNDAVGLGSVRSPLNADALPMREIMADYLEEQAQRRAIWTSANPNE